VFIGVVRLLYLLLGHFQLLNLPCDLRNQFSNDSCFQQGFALLQLLLFQTSSFLAHLLTAFVGNRDLRLQFALLLAFLLPLCVFLLFELDLRLQRDEMLVSDLLSENSLLKLNFIMILLNETVRELGSKKLNLGLTSYVLGCHELAL
jgi:hypothetical protein